ncbi:MAG: CBS domain-containing protein [Phycisphaerales bacterium]|nr:CBS domain-containing protein [Phycisphaerales bacterium]
MTPADPASRDVTAPAPLRIEASTTVRELAHLLAAGCVSGASVVNERGVALGTITRSDLLRRSSGVTGGSPEYLLQVNQEDEDARREPDAADRPLAGAAADFRRTPPRVTTDTPVATIVSLMLDRSIRRIAVFEAEPLPTVIITTLDLRGAAVPQPPAPPARIAGMNHEGSTS